jgi:hypothetical protein
MLERRPEMTTRATLMIAVALIGAVTLLHAQQSGSPLLIELNAIAQRQLRDRARTVSAIRDTAAAQARQKRVRERILSLIGGLPEYRGHSMRALRKRRGATGSSSITCCSRACRSIT